MSRFRSSGIYFLIIHVPLTILLTIGRLGEITFKPGYYIYVGSAMGSGGLKARVERHLRKDRRTHWHIDYLMMCA